MTWTYERQPTVSDFKNTPRVVQAKHGKSHLITFLSDSNMVPKNGTYYVGLLPYSDSMKYRLKRADSHLTFDNDDMPMALNYNITIFISRCLYHENGQWKEDGCKVMYDLTLDI